MCHRVGLLQVPLPSNANQVLVASCPPGAESTTLIDMHDVWSPPSYAACSSDDDWNDMTKDRNAPTFGLAQLKAGIVLLCQLVTALVVQVTVIASDIVSLKDRITAIEDAQTLPLVHGQGIEALTQQISKLCERVASQEDRIAVLELSQRVETDSHKMTIQELTTKLDGMRVDSDKSCDNTLKDLRQSFKNFQQLMECQAARVTGIKADTARKVALLQSELAGVQAELAVIKKVVVPVNASSAGQTAKECWETRISVTQRIGVAEMAEGKNLCGLPSVTAQSSPRVTVFQDASAALTSSSGSSSTLPNYRKNEKTTVKDLKTTKEPLTIARVNVAQPGAGKVPAIPMIPMSTIPMECPIHVKGNGKENMPCNSSTTTVQYTKTPQPSAGRFSDIRDKSPTVSPKDAQPGAGPLSKVSMLPKPRKSMLPAPQKLHLPNLAKRAAVVDGDPSSEVKTTVRLPGESETQTEQPGIVKVTPIVTSRPPLQSALSTLAEREPPPVLPASTSLATLDAAFQAMQVDSSDLLALVQAPNCSNIDLSFSAVTPISANTTRNDRCECIYDSPRQRNADVKPPRSPPRSTLAILAESKVLLPASSSLAALDVAMQTSQGEGDILAFMPGPDYCSVDLSFSTVTPILIKAKSHCKRESIYMSPKKVAIKPSRRL